MKRVLIHINAKKLQNGQISAKTFPADFDTGTKAITLSFPQKGQLYKITMQASGVEGAARDIPFRILTRDLS